MRRSGRRGRGRRIPLARGPLRAPIVPKKFFHTAGQLRRPPRRAAGRRLVAPGALRGSCSSRTSTRSSARTTPSSTRGADQGARLRARAGDRRSARPASSSARTRPPTTSPATPVFNDITARDIQRREMQSGVFSFSKAIDTFCPIGPWIVTADEVPDPHALADGAAGQRRAYGSSGNTARRSSRSRTWSRTTPAQGYSAGDILTTGHDLRRGRRAAEPVRASTCSPGTASRPRSRASGVLRNHVVPWAAARRRPIPPTSTPRPAREYHETAAFSSPGEGCQLAWPGG